MLYFFRKGDGNMSNKKAAVFILLGQSNAAGHGTPMDSKDIISPLKNVFGLSRENNQSLDNTKLLWTPYTSYSMNLAEELDNTYSIANCLAAIWQKHIDNGNLYNLPNLYILQIAIGSQGVTEEFMWYPNRAPKLIPGKLGQVDISLFPFTKHIFSLLDRSFVEMGQDYEIIGLHWRGGESDSRASVEYLSEHLEAIYNDMFNEFDSLLKKPPIILHKLVCYDFMKDVDSTGKGLESMHCINRVFDTLKQKRENISVFDASTAPQFIPHIRGNGLFVEDIIHFTAEVNAWIAENILNKYCGI